MEKYPISFLISSSVVCLFFKSRDSLSHLADFGLNPGSIRDIQGEAHAIKAAEICCRKINVEGTGSGDTVFTKTIEIMNGKVTYIRKILKAIIAWNFQSNFLSFCRFLIQK